MSDAAQTAPLLVVGAGGSLGRAVAAHLRSAPGAPSGLATSRKPDAPLFVDLASDPATWRLPAAPQAGGSALLLAALTSVEACANDPALAQRINVDALLVLARRLVDQGYFLVFPSTSQVFDGGLSHAAGPPRPSDPTNPQTVYGRHKALAETILRAEFPDSVAVLRMTKVLDPDNWLIRRWTQAFLRGERVGAFADMRMAPVGEDLAAAALVGLAQARAPGVFHLSASRDMTYFHAAQLGAASLGADPELVRPERYADRDADREVFAPEHTALFVEQLCLPGLAPGASCPEPEAAVLRAFALAGAALSTTRQADSQHKGHE